MQVIAILFTIILFTVVGVVIATKFGKFKDEDADGIPDQVENKVDEKLSIFKKFLNKFKK